MIENDATLISGMRHLATFPPRIRRIPAAAGVSPDLGMEAAEGLWHAFCLMRP